MDKSTQTNLCKGLRACGIPRSLALEVLNTVEKWERESGPQWTNTRIKDLRQWYETTLSGSPKAPEWFRHTKSGTPTGVWAKVFKLPPAKALGVLSCNTVFYEQQVTKVQEEKFLKGLAGNQSQNQDRLKALLAKDPRFFAKPPFKRMPEIQFPTLFDMNGSAPVHEGRVSMRNKSQSLGYALETLRASWDSIPQVTFNFLVQQNLEGFMPQDVVGNAYALELDGRPHERCVGRIGVDQQAQLKARWFANLNRVTQVTLDPLKKVFMTLARNLPTDVTFDQQSGMHWCQDQLKQGIELAGSDLTSASDLLDVRMSLELVEHVFGLSEIEGYNEYRDYFLEVSRSNWYCPALNREVQWQQGDALGSGPSFGLLTLTNNVCAMLAFKEAQLAGVIDKRVAWKDSFRVLGDDIIMRSEIEPYYTKNIEMLGGEINHSKTLKSDKVAEFAGRVITSDRIMLKAIKYSEPSDNSFMSYVAQLGSQAKSLLRPRQRRTWNLLKEVPGVVVDGPWTPDSYGISLSDRYQWYLEEVQPALQEAEPDLKLEDYEMLLLRAELSLDESGKNEEVRSLDEPLFDVGYLPTQVIPVFKSGGDPRLTNGKTLLEVLETKGVHITPFQTWYRNQSQTRSNDQFSSEETLSANETEEPFRKVSKSDYDWDLDL